MNAISQTHDSIVFSLNMPEENMCIIFKLGVIVILNLEIVATEYKVT